MTISWTMVLDFTPVFAITTGEWNHSFAALRKTRECVIAIPTVDMLDKVVGIGTCSGADTDKFARFDLTPVKGKVVGAPLIKECLANIECQVIDIVRKHNIVVLEAVAASVDAAPVVEAVAGIRSTARARQVHDDLLENSAEFTRVRSHGESRSLCRGLRKHPRKRIRHAPRDDIGHEGRFGLATSRGANARRSGTVRTGPCGDGKRVQADRRGRVSSCRWRRCWTRRSARGSSTCLSSTRWRMPCRRRPRPTPTRVMPGTAAWRHCARAFSG